RTKVGGYDVARGFRFNRPLRSFTGLLVPSGYRALKDRVLEPTHGTNCYVRKACVLPYDGQNDIAYIGSRSSGVAPPLTVEALGEHNLGVFANRRRLARCFERHEAGRAIPEYL